MSAALHWVLSTGVPSAPIPSASRECSRPHSRSTWPAGTRLYPDRRDGNNATGGLSLGTNPGSIGTYSLSGTGMLVAEYEYVGSASSGTLTQLGGTNNAAALSVGSGTASGVYTLGGVLNAGNESVGSSGVSTFTQSGGTNTLTGIFSISRGTYNFSGGLLSVPAIQAPAFPTSAAEPCWPTRPSA